MTRKSASYVSSERHTTLYSRIRERRVASRREPPELRRAIARSWWRAEFEFTPNVAPTDFLSRLTRRDSWFAEARVPYHRGGSKQYLSLSFSLSLSLSLSLSSLSFFPVLLSEFSRPKTSVHPPLCLPSNTERFAERVYLGTSNTRNVSESFLPFFLSFAVVQLQSAAIFSLSREARLIFARGGLQWLCPSAAMYITAFRFRDSGISRVRARARVHVHETRRDVKTAAELPHQTEQCSRRELRRLTDARDSTDSPHLPFQTSRLLPHAASADLDWARPSSADCAAPAGRPAGARRDATRRAAVRVYTQAATSGPARTKVCLINWQTNVIVRNGKRAGRIKALDTKVAHSFYVGIDSVSWNEVKIIKVSEFTRILIISLINT